MGKLMKGCGSEVVEVGPGRLVGHVRIAGHIYHLLYVLVYSWL